MGIKAVRYLNSVLMSVLFGVMLSQALELPGLAELSFPVYAQVERILYRDYLWLMRAIEIGTLLAMVWLLFVVRSRPIAFIYTLVSMTFLVALMVVWLFFMYPVYNTVLSWQTTSAPPNWTEIRGRLEFLHVVRAVLGFLSISALLLSVLNDRPTAEALLEPNAPEAPETPESRGRRAPAA